MKRKNKSLFFILFLLFFPIFLDKLSSFVFNVSIINSSSSSIKEKNYICLQLNNYYNCYSLNNYPYYLDYSINNNYLMFKDDQGNNLFLYLNQPLNGSIIYYKRQKEGNVINFEVSLKKINYNSIKISLIKDKYNNSLFLLNGNRISPLSDNNYLSFYINAPSKITVINLDSFKGGFVFYAKIKTYLNITICANNSCFYYENWPNGFFKLEKDVFIKLNNLLLVKVGNPKPNINYLVNLNETMENKTKFKKILLSYFIIGQNISLLAKKMGNLSFFAEINGKKIDASILYLNDSKYYLIPLEEGHLNNLKLVYYLPLDIKIIKKNKTINATNNPFIKEFYDGENLEINDLSENLKFKAKNCSSLNNNLVLSLFYVSKNNTVLLINASPLNGFNCEKYSLIVPLTTTKIKNLTKFNGTKVIKWEDYSIVGNKLIINFYEKDPLFGITLAKTKEIEGSILIFNNFFVYYLLFLFFILFLVN